MYHGSKYNPLPLNDKVPYVDVYRRNIIPNIGGGLGGELGNRWFQYEYNNWKDKNNEK